MPWPPTSGRWDILACHEWEGVVFEDPSGAQYGAILPYARTHESGADLHSLDPGRKLACSPR